MKYRDFPITAVGFLVSTFLILLCYVAYYVFLYPVIAQTHLYQSAINNRNNTSPIYPIEVSYSAPIYISSYQPSKLFFSLRNVSLKSVTGKLIIAPQLILKPEFIINNSNAQIDDPLLFSSDIRSESLVLVPKTQDEFAIDLDSGEMQQFPLSIQLSSNRTSYVVIRVSMNLDQREDMQFFPSFTQQPSQVASTGYNTITPTLSLTPQTAQTKTLTPIPSKTRTQSETQTVTDTPTYTPTPTMTLTLTPFSGYIPWESSVANIPAVCSNNPQQICITNDPYGVFLESVLQRLLLPPFSNSLIPFLIFGIVWFVELVLPAHKEDREKKWTQFVRKKLAVISGMSSILSYMLTVLVVSSLLLGIVSFFAGSIFFFLDLYKWTWPFYVFLVLCLGVILFFVFRFFRDGGTSNSEDVEDIEAMEKAFREKNLKELGQIKKDWLQQKDTRYQRADIRYETLYNELQSYTENIANSLKKKSSGYTEALDKTYILTMNSPHLTYLPDMDAKLSLQPLEQTVEFRGWILTDPKGTELYKMIYTSITNWVLNDHERACSFIKLMVTTYKGIKGRETIVRELEEILKNHGCDTPDKPDEEESSD